MSESIINTTKLNIDMNIDTQTTVAKLRVIAKHTAALADELEALDNPWKCEGCGHDTYETCNLIGDDQNYYASNCTNCGLALD